MFITKLFLVCVTIILILSCSIPMTSEAILENNRKRAFSEQRTHSVNNNVLPLIFYHLTDDNAEVYIMCYSLKYLDFIPAEYRNRTHFHFPDLSKLNIPTENVTTVEDLKSKEYYGMTQKELIDNYLDENNQIIGEYNSYFLFYLLTQGFYVAFVGEFGNELYIDY